MQGYRPGLCYRVYVDKALEIAARGPNSRPLRGGLGRGQPRPSRSSATYAAALAIGWKAAH